MQLEEALTSRHAFDWLPAGTWHGFDQVEAGINEFSTINDRLAEDSEPVYVCLGTGATVI